MPKRERLTPTECVRLAQTVELQVLRQIYAHEQPGNPSERIAGLLIWLLSQWSTVNLGEDQPQQPLAEEDLQPLETFKGLTVGQASKSTRRGAAGPDPARVLARILEPRRRKRAIALVIPALNAAGLDPSDDAQLHAAYAAANATARAEDDAVTVSKFVRQRGDRLTLAYAGLAVELYDLLLPYYPARGRAVGDRQHALVGANDTGRLPAVYPRALLETIAALITGRVGHIVGRVGANDVRRAVQYRRDQDAKLQAST